MSKNYKSFISFLSETLFNKTIKIIVCIGNGNKYVIVGRIKQIFADFEVEKRPIIFGQRFGNFEHSVKSPGFLYDRRFLSQSL